MGEAIASCPKCGTTRDDTRTHCSSCGLGYDKMSAFAAARDAVPDALGLAWDRAVASWDDATAHDEVLRLVGKHDAYAWAAARYRDRAREQPDDAVAKRQLERVRKAAEATLLSSAAAKRQPKTPEPYRATIAILGLLIILIIALVVYAVARGGAK